MEEILTQGTPKAVEKVKWINLDSYRREILSKTN
jgi:hypothetical protein